MFTQTTISKREISDPIVTSAASSHNTGTHTQHFVEILDQSKNKPNFCALLLNVYAVYKTWMCVCGIHEMLKA